MVAEDIPDEPRPIAPARPDCPIGEGDHPRLAPEASHDWHPGAMCDSIVKRDASRGVEAVIAP